MSFNINNVTKYKKLKIRGKTIEKETTTFQIPLEKDVNNSEESEQSQDSTFRNTKIVIPSRSSFFDRFKLNTPFKKTSKEKKFRNNIINVETNKNKIKTQNESNDKINSLITNNKINLKKYTKTINNQNNQISYRIIINKKLEDKLIPPIINNQTHATSKKNFSNLNPFNNKIRNILSSGYRYKQNKAKNKIFNTSLTLKNDKKLKNIFKLNKRNLSNNAFNEEKYLIDSYAYKNKSLKIKINKNSSNKTDKNSKKNLISILETNNSNQKDNINLKLENIFKNNFFQENKNFMIKYGSREKQDKKEDKKKYVANFSFDEEKKNKCKESENDKSLLKRHNLNKKNIKFNQMKYINPNKFTVVENNNSLQETFKIQTVSNFNNKYNFKFKTKNPKEKEKIEELFVLLKLHKNSEDVKNNDFLNFELNSKKRNKKHIGKVFIEKYIKQKNYNFGNDKKGNKMISLKTLTFIEKK